MFNTALTYTAIKNFQKNLSKPIDNKKEIIYNNDIENERGNVKMLENIMVKNVIEKIMLGEIKIKQLFFFSEDIGFINANELFFYEEGITLHNVTIDEEESYHFDDDIFIMINEEE